MISMLLTSIDVAPPSGSSSPDVEGKSTGSAVHPSVEVDEAAVEFEGMRPRLFGVAYRVLGGAADAEDVVQDVWVRWQGADRSRVQDPMAFLVTITTRLALNAATSARARREVSVGDAPGRGVALAGSAGDTVSAGSLESALALLIERLSPDERAVYVLREAFDYPFREIARALDLTEPNARQVARRARARLGEQPRSPFDQADREGLLRAFLGAARAGEMSELFDVLADHIHGGGRMRTRSLVVAG
jgi:RNA polymerase sigma-70 factor, ECF subfamily